MKWVASLSYFYYCGVKKLTMMNRYNKNAVYITYARNDESKVEWEHIADFIPFLKDAIREEGIECYIDTDDLRLGDSITEYENAIGDAKCVIIVFSERYFRSAHCMYEYFRVKDGLEKRRIKKIICINSGGFDFNDDTLWKLRDFWSGKKGEYKGKVSKTAIEQATERNCFYINDVWDLRNFFKEDNYAKAENLDICNIKRTLRELFNFSYKTPFSITSCDVANVTEYGVMLDFDADHTQYLKPTITYQCTQKGTYDIYVKLYKNDGKLSTGVGSPYGYSQVNNVFLSNGTGKIALTGWGGSDSGHWTAGTYRYEFFYNSKLLFIHQFTINEPFIITSCDVKNTTKEDRILPFDAAHTQYISPTLNFQCSFPGTYEIFVKLFDSEGNLSIGNESPDNYSYSNKCKLNEGTSSIRVGGWGSQKSGNWNAGNYKFEFYYKDRLLFTQPFTIEEGLATYVSSYVDLGLPSGALWATCNIDAQYPWECGNYFDWGKKLTNSEWRLPTIDEWQELKENCYWEWTENFNGKGVSGYIVRSQKKDSCE